MECWYGLVRTFVSAAAAMVVLLLRACLSVLKRAKAAGAVRGVVRDVPMRDAWARQADLRMRRWTEGGGRDGPGGSGGLVARAGGVPLLAAAHPGPHPGQEPAEVR
ncbi:hypothetical protein GCM10010400_57630 [Streptomyces aculeolatus]